MEIEVMGRFQEQQEFKDGNTVQNILKESVDVEMNQRSEASSDIPRYYAPFIGNLSELTENLILTSASSVRPHILEMLDLSCVISCAPELSDPPLVDDATIYHKVEVVDSGSSRINKFFDEAADLIHKVSSSNRKTLVYCVAGVSRSATICIAYFMKHHQMSLKEAYTFVKQRRNRIRPNCGFFKQLIEYEKELFGQNSVKMIFNEVVQMEIPDVYDSEYRRQQVYTRKRCAVI